MDFIIWALAVVGSYVGIGTVTAVHEAKHSYRKRTEKIDAAWEKYQHRYHSSLDDANIKRGLKRDEWEDIYRAKSAEHAGSEGMFAAIIWPLYWGVKGFMGAMSGMDKAGTAIQSKLGRIASDPVEAERRAAKQLEEAMKIVAEHEARQKEEWDRAALKIEQEAGSK